MNQLPFCRKGSLLTGHYFNNRISIIQNRMETVQPKAILLIHCPDQSGIVASVTQFISKYNGNILDLDQHVDKHANIFFMRVAWELNSFGLAEDALRDAFSSGIAKPYNMTWNLHITRKKQRMAVFVSKQSHCLFDILARFESGEWEVDIPLIISNHTELETVANRLNIDFHHVSVTKTNKVTAEQRQRELLQRYNIDFIVLARYMQILSEDFVNDFPSRIINIHHSFLPAFPGAKPYHSAYERGVKLIGATSHYVTAELDQGPIIDQDVIHVNHKHSIDDLVRKGRDLEKVVLSRAIWSHLHRKTLVFKNRTVIFQ